MTQQKMGTSQGRSAVENEPPRTLTSEQIAYLRALADGEWHHGIKIDSNSYRRNPRLRALERKGLVRQDRARLFSNGAVRWQITDDGWEALASQETTDAA